MQTQWYLCEITNFPEHEGNDLRKTDNLSVKHPDIFIGGLNALMGEEGVNSNKEGKGQWYVWLPIIPRVGDTLQFSGWQVEVSKVVLETDWTSKTGLKEKLFVSARISIRDDVVPKLSSSHFAIESLDNKALHKWEDYARRGNDLQYYAWELRHETYLLNITDLYHPSTKNTEEKVYYRWHTRVRPVAGDIIVVKDNRWRVTSVELASANVAIDGWLTLEASA